MQSHGSHAKNFALYPGSHKKALTTFKQDSEVTRCLIQKALFGFRIQSLYFLNESMLSKDAKRKQVRTPQPWFGLLYLTNHSLGPESQSGILQKFAMFTSKNLKILWFN